MPHLTVLARLNDGYQRLVLRGESPQPKDLEVAPRLKYLKGCCITIANHPYGAVLILTDSHRCDIGARA